MWNPTVFPLDPIKVSQGWEHKIGHYTTESGAPGGLYMWPTGSVVAQPGGQIEIAFGFIL